MGHYSDGDDEKANALSSQSVFQTIDNPIHVAPEPQIPAT
jgi:hypothetical protein